MKPYKDGRNFGLAEMIVLAAIGLGVTGCQSFSQGPADDSTASIKVFNRTPDQILTVTRRVFLAHGFYETAAAGNQITFERPGTTADKMAYGSYMFDQTVNLRVIVTVKPIDSTYTLVGCKAWQIQSGGGGVIDDKHEVLGLRKRPYEDLMDKIKEQLLEPQPSPNQP
jgi:hypothetical protein